MRILSLVLLAACGTKATPPDKPPGPGTAARTSDDAAPAAAGDAATATVDPPVVEVDVPIEPAALQAWLFEGKYKGWPKESGKHESAGPHGDAVITYFTPSLIASLKKGKGRQHPRGAAAVKELFEKGKPNGWAVSVKLAEDSDEGRNWYWYEVFSNAKDAKAPYQGKGFNLCRDCHSERGGNDHVQSPFPLQ